MNKLFLIACLLIPNLLLSQSDEKIKSVKWYIDCGDDDYLFEGSSRVHIAMKNRNIPHEYRVRDGDHSLSLIHI